MSFKIQEPPSPSYTAEELIRALIDKVCELEKRIVALEHRNFEDDEYARE